MFTSVLVAVGLAAAGWATVAAVDQTPAEAGGALPTACDRLVWSGVDDGAVLEVWVADADGTNRASISDLDADPDPVSNVGPQWSPDGARIAWHGRGTANNEIWVADASGASRTKISDFDTDPDPVDNRGPMWSPDGSRIAWFGNTGGNQIWVADANGASRTNISVAGTDPDPTSNFAAQWSPDGTRIAWAGRDGAPAVTNQIWVADADGTNRTKISDVGTGADPVGDVGPQWSPDGTRIAWQAHDGTTDQIWVADADGNNRTKISAVGTSAAPTNNGGPQWSPDGARIAWFGNDGGGNQIWVADADGANRTKISLVGTDPDPTFNLLPQWSPDGNRIAWHGMGAGGFQIWTADADGTNRTVISTVSLDPDPTSNSAAQWRPRAGDLALGSATSALVVGQPATMTVTVTSTCPHGSVVVGGIAAPACLGSSGVGVSHGSLTGSVWTIGALDGTATATITGTVTTPGACAGTATVTGSLPTLATATLKAFGGTATNTTTTTVPAGVDPSSCLTPADPFTDVAASASASADITCVYNLGITTGNTATTYNPTAYVTRQQMGAFVGRLWRVLGRTCPATPTAGPADPFTDIPASSYARADITCIYNLGITTGSTGTTYNPAGFVSREQAAAFLARLWRALGNTCATAADPFTDIPASSFARADITCSYNLGVTTGTSATTYTPSANITRDHMATMLARLWRAAID